MSHSKNKYIWQDQHQEILGTCQTRGSISINATVDAAGGTAGDLRLCRDFTLMVQSRREHPIVAASAPR